MTLALGDPGKNEPLVIGYRLANPAKHALALVASAGALPKADMQWLESSLTNMKVTAAPDETHLVTDPAGRLILAVALPAKGDLETLRRSAGAAARALLGHVQITFAIACADLHELMAVAEGALLGSYQFHQFKGDSSTQAMVEKITIAPGRTIRNANAALQRVEAIIDRVHFVRNLINMPPSYLTPEKFISLVKAQLPTSVKANVKNHVQLKREGFGGIIAVGQGSANPPQLLHLSYRPAKAKRKFAYVGKGITFDTGGLALKPAQGMEAMKSDMSGAAAVSAAILAIAELKLPVAIDAWAPLAENMVSDTATRPSDIITIYGGKTVEVLNPDAEGRLVLADAMMKAAEVGKKNGLDGLIDVATLTGAQVVALGTRTSAVMTNNQEFSEKFLQLAETTGEQFWPMPLPEELRASLDSPVADIANIGDRMGGMLVAGLFLKEFVAPELPWLHLDIAGPAYNDGKAHGYTPVGGTGVALRTLVALAESAASQ